MSMFIPMRLLSTDQVMSMEIAIQPKRRAEAIFPQLSSLLMLELSQMSLNTRDHDERRNPGVL